MFFMLDWLCFHSSYRVKVHDVFVYSLCIHELRAGSLRRTAEPRHIMYSLCTHEPAICWVWFQSLMTWQRTRKSPCLKFCSSDLISLTACLKDNLRFQLFLIVGRFLSKSDSGLKNLISSPTSSPHKTISFLPPTAFYLSVLCTAHRIYTCCSLCLCSLSIPKSIRGRLQASACRLLSYTLRPMVPWAA